MIYDIAGRTKQGPVRGRNEDHLLLGGWIRNSGWMAMTLAADDEVVASRGLLLAIADGMGGHAGGRTASRLALETLAAALSRTSPPGGSAAIAAEDLSAALGQANAAVLKAQTTKPELAGMGTTLSALLFTATGYWVLHTGDSRVMRVRNRFLRKLTRDDNVRESMIAQGIDAETAAASPEANALTNWMGNASMQPMIAAGDASEPGDQLLICSDGLYGFVDGGTIVAALDDRHRPLHESVNSLIDSAMAAGSDDNLSLIIVRITDATGTDEGVTP